MHQQNAKINRAESSPRVVLDTHEVVVAIALLLSGCVTILNVAVFTNAVGCWCGTALFLTVFSL